MRATSLTDALEAMASMEKGKPYGLRLDDAKRRLADDLARLCAVVWPNGADIDPDVLYSAVSGTPIDVAAPAEPR